MRHAFLIIAHSNWWQLKKLIECLDAENHDFYIHIDKKSLDFNEHYFVNNSKKSLVKFYQRYKVYWGGVSQVKVELFLFKEAFQFHYDYYHIISGMDLPLKNNQEMDAFFERHRGKNFISYDNEGLEKNPEISRRAKYYHFLQNYRRRYKQKWKNNIFTILERLLLIFQIIFRINRVKNLDWKIMYGSNWVSVTHELVDVLLNNEEKILNIFKYTNCADELYKQTIAYNCGFKETVYQPELNNSPNLRYIDWNRGKNGNPYTFCSKDEEILKEVCNNSDYIFARKFNEKIDKGIIEYIFSTIYGN